MFPVFEEMFGDRAKKAITEAFAHNSTPSNQFIIGLILRDLIKEVDELKDEVKILRNDRKPE